MRRFGIRASCRNDSGLLGRRSCSMRSQSVLRSDSALIQCLFEVVIPQAQLSQGLDDERFAGAVCDDEIRVADVSRARSSSSSRNCRTATVSRHVLPRLVLFRRDVRFSELALKDDALPSERCLDFNSYDAAWNRFVCVERQLWVATPAMELTQCRHRLHRAIKHIRSHADFCVREGLGLSGWMCHGLILRPYLRRSPGPRKASNRSALASTTSVLPS